MLLAVSLAGAALAVGAAVAPRSADAAPSPCGQGSWVAGTVDICDGELVYHDYVYDDFGARPSIPGITLPEIVQGLGLQSVPNFDAYGGLPPAGGQKDHDQTDLVALRIRRRRGEVPVSAGLNAMTWPNAAKARVHHRP